MNFKVRFFQLLAMLFVSALILNCGGTEEKEESPVIPDTTPPTVLSIDSADTRSVDVVFSEAVDKTAGETGANYQISAALIPGLAILSATRTANNSGVVRLALNKILWPFAVSITIKNVTDEAGNVMAASQTFDFTGFAKVAFVTLQEGTGKFSTWAHSGGQDGLIGADSICQHYASTRGFLGEFKAWLSDSTTDAVTRIGRESGPWIRTDGHPICESFDEMLAGYSPLVPIRYDAQGTQITGGTRQVFSYTDIDGTKRDEYFDNDNHCQNWTSEEDTDSADFGYQEGTVDRWTYKGDNTCAVESRLFCFQIGKGAKIASYYSEGKKAFASSVEGSGNLGSWDGAGGNTGIEAGDAICQNLAQSAGYDNHLLFKAWLSDGSTDAINRFNPAGGPWVQPNGVKIADSLTDLTDGMLFSAIAFDENYDPILSTNNAPRAWTGTGFNGIAVADHCTGWTNGTDADDGAYGNTQSASEFWTNTNIVKTCDLPARLYCLEDTL